VRRQASVASYKLKNFFRVSAAAAARLAFETMQANILKIRLRLLRLRLLNIGLFVDSLSAGDSSSFFSPSLRFVFLLFLS
jgi:hypothetical protein